MEKIIYLAIPYTWNPDKSFEIANRASAMFMNEGKIVFSPISHSHPIADYLPDKLRCDQVFWMNQDIPILKKCDELVVVLIGKDGLSKVNNSKGCQKEIRIAEENNIPIKYISYHE